MIKLENISKAYQNKTKSVKVLTDVTLSIDKGEIFGILGPSGVGKSTLVKILSLMEKADSGTYYLDGLNVKKLNKQEIIKAKNGFGYAFQDFNLLSQISVIDNVMLPLKLRKVPRKERLTIAKNALAYVGLKEQMNQYPNTLSGGQNQRVALARAIVSKPLILFCDEVTSSLDNATALEVLNLLKKINRDEQITIILISHDVNVIKYLCDRAIILKDGEIIKEGLVNHSIDGFTDPYKYLWRKSNE